MKPVNVERLDFHFIMIEGALGGSSKKEEVKVAFLDRIWTRSTHFRGIVSSDPLND